MVMKKVLFVLVIWMVCITTIPAQTDSVYTGNPQPKPRTADNKGKTTFNWRERLVFGGNFGLSFGSITYVDLSPLVGVRVTDKFVPSIGGIYTYYRYESRKLVYSANMYGARLQAQYFFWPQLFGQIGYDFINRNNPYSLDPNSRINVENYWIGGGYRQMMGSSAALQLSVLYNLNQTIYSPYMNPNIYIGIVAGF